MPQTYPQRIFKCKQLSIVGLKVKCAQEQGADSQTCLKLSVSQDLSLS